MSTSVAVREVQEDKMNALLGKVVGDFGAALGASLAYIGHKLGLFKALANSGPVTSGELSKKTGTNERYVREWLVNQAASGYIEYDPGTKRYSLSPEQEVAMTAEDTPFYVGGGFYVIKAMVAAEPRITQAFKDGGGLLWGDHDPDLFAGVEKFFRPGYTAHLTASWLPALDGAVEKLEAGAKVADVGCGHGASSIIMARAFPKSKFYGFDSHGGSIDSAKQRAEEAGVTGNLNFEVSDARSIPANSYDLITLFDCLHDMGDPVGAMKRAYEALADDGSVLIVEPMAGDTVEDNFNPVGRVFSGASTLCCTANSMALGGPALGAVATEAALRETVEAGGFSHFRRVTETPFNRVFEARK